MQMVIKESYHAVAEQSGQSPIYTHCSGEWREKVSNAYYAPSKFI